MKFVFSIYLSNKATKIIISTEKYEKIKKKKYSTTFSSYEHRKNPMTETAKRHEWCE